MSTRVAAKLGINAPGAYDINTACSGFSYALGTVDHAIRAGAARNAIVIGAEKLSDFTDWTDRSTCIIFGDGAGAAVVTAAEPTEAAGIGPVVWGSAPEKGDAVRIEGWRPYIQQEGQAVFRWATTSLAPLALQACERAGVDPVGDRRVRPAPGQRAHHRRDRQAARPCRTRSSPRTSSSPATRRRPASRWPCPSWSSGGRCPSGAPVLLFGFGGGLTYAGQVVRCP